MAVLNYQRVRENQPTKSWKREGYSCSVQGVEENNLGASWDTTISYIYKDNNLGTLYIYIYHTISIVDLSRLSQYDRI